VVPEIDVQDYAKYMQFSENFNPPIWARIYKIVNILGREIPLFTYFVLGHNYFSLRAKKSWLYDYNPTINLKFLSFSEIVIYCEQKEA
jgi:hypothetical protein